MNEGSPKPSSQEQPNKDEHLRLQENYRKYEELKLQYDVRGAGANWYRQLLRDGFDLGRIFNHLSLHSKSADTFRDHMYHIVKAQLSFQRHLTTLEQRIDHTTRQLKIPEKYIDNLREAGKRLQKLQDKYKTGRSNNGKKLSNNDLSKMDTEAAKTFDAVWVETQNAARGPWPYDEIVEEEEKPSATSQPEHNGPQQENGQNQNGKQGEEGPSAASGGGGTKGPEDKGGTADDADGPNESNDRKSENREEFEFKPEMLRTVEGRWKVFKEMARMYNQVLHRRDNLGFDGKKHLVNDAFDGFDGVYRRYPKMKAFIRELSNRAVIRKRKKITGINPEIDVSDVEVKDFNEGYYALKSFYDRTNAFYQQAQPEPEPEPTPEPEPQPEPEPEPEPQPEPEKKAYEERLEVRRKWQYSKKAYEDAYAEYVGRRKNAAEKFIGLFKEEQKPDKLLTLEREYQEARRAYAGSLNSALKGRYVKGSAAEKREIIEGPEGINAALANRFVLRAAHEKLARERELIPQGRAQKVFEDMQAFFKKNGKIVKVAGYVTAAGIGLTIGGFGYALTAIAGKAATAKIVGGAAAVSALAANLGYDLAFLNRAEKERTNSAKRARYAYSEDRLDMLEDEYLKRYRAYENSARNKKYVVAGAAIAGGVAAGIATGNVDAEEIIDATPGMTDTPRVEVPAPEPEVNDTPFPDPDRSSVIPDGPSFEPEASPEIISPLPADEPIEPIIELELEPEPQPTPEPELDEDKLENVEKDEQLKNPAPFGEEPDSVEPHPSVDEDGLLHEYEDEPDTEVEVPELLHTFEAGDKIDTVSEALFESWKADHSVLGEELSSKEFLSQMYGAIAEIEKYPNTHSDLLEQMGVTSGDLDKVQVGQTIDMRPFFEYLNNK